MRPGAVILPARFRGGVPQTPQHDDGIRVKREESDFRGCRFCDHKLPLITQHETPDYELKRISEGKPIPWSITVHS